MHDLRPGTILVWQVNLSRLKIKTRLFVDQEEELTQYSKKTFVVEGRGISEQQKRLQFSLRQT